MIEKKISVVTATNLVVANMVGTGVFTSLGFQVAGITSDFALIALWIVGGMLALCGALSYAELATALPRSGGEYHFLSRIYHPSVGFLSGWISVVVGFPAPIALAGIAFGGYFKIFAPGISPVLLSLLIIWIITLVHLFGIHVEEMFQNGSTFLKIGLILVLIVAGLLIANPQAVSMIPRAEDLKVLVSRPFAVDLVYVMYAYSGWNAATYITEEVRDPAKNVPWALSIGTVAVTVLYLALNYVFLFTTPRSVLSGKLEVGLLAGEAIFGPVGGKVVSLLIGLGLIATISAMAWIGPRVTRRMAEDLPKLRLLGKTSTKGTPYAATILQVVIATILVATGTFETVLFYTQFSLLLSSFLTVLGLIVLRIREPKLERPYKVWGYPVIPIFFLAITLWMMLHVVLGRPAESLLGLITVIAGLIIYFFAREPGRTIHSRP